MHRIVLLIARFLYPISEAVTDSEKLAIYRLRYDIYIDELKRPNIYHADHNMRSIVDEADHYSNTRLFYIGAKSDPIASFRLTLFNPEHEQRPEFETRYALDNYPEFKESNLVELSRMVIRRSQRKSWAMLSVVQFLFKFCVMRYCDAALLYCTPALARSYRQFGFRPYQAIVNQVNVGMKIPVINILSDTGYYKKEKSILRSMQHRLFIKYRYPLFPIKLIEGRLDLDSTAFRVDTPKIQDLVYEELYSKNRSHFLNDLSQNELELLCEYGLIITVNRGAVLTQRLAEIGVYILISGNLQMTGVNGCESTLLETGSVFGDIESSEDSGQIRPNITALENSQILMLSHSLVSKISGTHNDLAIKVLLNLSMILANRLAVTPQYKIGK